MQYSKIAIFALLGLAVAMPTENMEDRRGKPKTPSPAPGPKPGPSPGPAPKPTSPPKAQPKKFNKKFSKAEAAGCVGSIGSASLGCAADMVALQQETATALEQGLTISACGMDLIAAAPDCANIRKQ